MSYLSGAVVNHDREIVDCNRFNVKMDRALAKIILGALGLALPDAAPETGIQTTKEKARISVSLGESQ